MTKLFLILLIIVIASFNAHATDKSIRCIGIFASTDPNAAEAQIKDFIAPAEVKRRLIQQSFYNPQIRHFVIEYAQLITDLYIEKFVEALEGKNHSDHKRLGYKSIADVRILKESVIKKQIRILSIMNPEDLTPEFEADFKRIAHKVYETHISKSDLLTLSTRLDGVIGMYSNNY